MKKILLGIILILVLAKQAGCDSTGNDDSVHSSMLTKAQAAAMCSRNGGKLSSYDEIKSNPLDKLDNGESIWQADHVELSPFISLEGCYKSYGLNHRFRLPGVKSVHDCIRECYNIKNFDQYIGIQENVCYCLTKRQIQEQALRRVNDALCTLTCDYNILDVCGSNSYISVYRIFEESMKNLLISEASKELCLYVKSISIHDDFLYVCIQRLVMVKMVL